MSLKKIILGMLFVASSLLASEINWAKDYKSGIKDAVAQNKPVVFISSRHSCKWCVVLDDTTLKDLAVVKALNDDFIAIIAYSDENDYMPRDLYTPGTPSIWFLKSDGEPMYQPIAGYIKTPQMLQALAIIKEEFNAPKTAPTKTGTK